MNYLVTAVILLGLAACSQPASEPAHRRDSETQDDKQEPGKVPPSDDAKPTEPDNPVHPKILFHGGGGMSTSSMIDMQPAGKILVTLGVPAQNIHLIKYPHTKNIAEINQSIDTQMKALVAKYPPNTRFDSIGHSLGLLASFISLSQLGYLPKMRSMIGVMGVLMRQDASAMPIGCKKDNTTDLCGDIFDKVMGSSDSPFILDLLSKNAAELKRINKCSIWSTQDGILSPPNAGVFPEGKSVEMPTSWCTKQLGFAGMLNPCHLKAKSSLDVFKAMRDQCFGGDFK